MKRTHEHVTGEDNKIKEQFIMFKWQRFTKRGKERKEQEMRNESAFDYIRP